jgi:hypothetical protein
MHVLPPQILPIIRERVKHVLLKLCRLEVILSLYIKINNDEIVGTQYETDHSERDIEKPYDSILSEAFPVQVPVRGSVTSSSPNSNRAVVCCTITETTKSD